MEIDATISLISKALDAAMMRQTAIANNVANVDTRGYQTMSVNFEEQLQNAHGLEIKDVKPVYELSYEKNTLDEQIALSVNNATHFRALVKGLNHKLGLMKLALGNNQS
jgi:flagellar basal-body rod protein FlgB